MAFEIKIQPIIPPKQWPAGGLKEFERLVENYLRGDLNRTIQGDFNKTTQKWSGRPTFKGDVTMNAREWSLFVYPTGRHAAKWGYLDQGVRSRGIRVKRARYLTIQDYTPHTKPGGKYGGSGKRHGEVTYAKEAPRWPGISKREFAKLVGNKRVKEVRIKVIALAAKAWQ